MKLSWSLVNVKDERVWVSAPTRFAIQWAGRMKQPYACYRLWDGKEKRAILGFINEEQAKDLAASLHEGDGPWTVGLVACCGKKLDKPAKASSLYQSDLFKKAFAFSRRWYNDTFILSAKYGLVYHNNVIEPYDQKLGSNDRDWGDKVVAQLAAIAKDRTVLFHAHAGQNYTEPLLTRVPMVFPMKGLGIGQQLAWYKDHLPS